MSASDLLLLIVAGITKGSIFGLVSICLQILFVSMGVLHFGIGAVALLGGLVAVSLRTTLGLHFAIALLVVLMMGLLIGYVKNRWILAPVRNRDVGAQIVCLLAVGIFMENGYNLIWGKMPLGVPPFPPFREGSAVSFFGAPLEPQSLWVMGVAAFTVLFIKLLLDHTYVGLVLRGAQNNPLAARLAGISPLVVGTYAYVISLGAISVSGMVFSPMTLAGGYLAMPLTIKGFAGMILGGSESPIGSFLGGLLLGVVATLFVAFVGVGYEDAICMGILILCLWFRPQGLFGKR